MHIEHIDLNLLRLFDAVYRLRSVSRAAELLQLTKPAASQGLTRLRRLLGDPLFARAAGGVAPTPRAERMAATVQQALAMLDEALAEGGGFDPAHSRRVFRLHLSDIGEARFLPDLMALLAQQAPQVRIETAPLPQPTIAQALDEGRIDFALGFLPAVKDTRRIELLGDRYIVLMRSGHPFLRGRRTLQRLESLQQLEFAAVRTHSDTLRILQLLKLGERLRLTVAHFLSLPAIVSATDLCVLMPRSIAQGLIATQAGASLSFIEPRFPLRDFTVALHWSACFDHDPGIRWLRGVVEQRFRALPAARPARRRP